MSEFPSRQSSLEQGMLEPNTYLTMVEEAADPTRYAILNTVVMHDEISATELADETRFSDNKSGLHYHLDELEDAELIQNKRGHKTDENGFYSYYTSTPYGDVVDRHIAETVNSMIEKEQDMRGQYAELTDESADYHDDIERLEEELSEVRNELREFQEGFSG